MKQKQVVKQLIQKYEEILTELDITAVESPEVFAVRAKLAYLKAWHATLV